VSGRDLGEGPLAIPAHNRRQRSEHRRRRPSSFLETRLPVLLPNDLAFLLRATMPTRSGSRKASAPDPLAYLRGSKRLLGSVP